LDSVNFSLRLETNDSNFAILSSRL